MRLKQFPIKFPKGLFDGGKGGLRNPLGRIQHLSSQHLRRFQRRFAAGAAKGDDGGHWVASRNSVVKPG